MAAVACDCCPRAVNVAKDVVQCGWLVCHMQYAVDHQFNNFATLERPLAASTQCTCVQTVQYAAKHVLLPCARDPWPDTAARHRRTSLAYKVSEVRHIIRLQGCKLGSEADLRMSRLRRREAGSLAKRPFRMDATSIMRLSLRRSSLGFARKR